MIALLDRIFLIAGFYFQPLNISCQSLLACQVTAEKSADNLVGFPLYETFSYKGNFFCWFLIKFSITTFCHFNYYVSWCGSSWVNFVEIILVLPGSGFVSFPRFRSCQLLFLQINFLPPFLSPSVWGPYNANVIILDSVTEYPKFILILHNFLSLSPAQLDYFLLLCSSSCLFILLLPLAYYLLCLVYF